MSSIVFVNGSLRGKKASSRTFLDLLEGELGGEAKSIRRVGIAPSEDGGFSAATLDILSEADAIVLAFPLFVYCLPGALMAFLESWYRCAKSRGAPGAGTRVYAIVNCGHAEPEINAEAIRVLANFCRRMGLTWGFAVAVGGGPVVAAAARLPLLGRSARRAFAAMAAGLESGGAGPRQTVLLRPPLPKEVLFFFRDLVMRKATKERTAA